MKRTLPPLVTLRAFEAAARHMSFKKAAEELGVTPTAISHQIQALEQACGCRLFRRRPRPLLLTVQGMTLLPVLRAAFDSVAATLASIRGLSNRVPLRVTTTNAFAHRCLVPRLATWRAIHPDVMLEIIGTDSVVDLAAGDADVAIRYQYAPPDGFVSQEICRDRFWLMCSPRLLTTGPPLRRPSDLSRHTVIEAR